MIEKGAVEKVGLYDPPMAMNQMCYAFAVNSVNQLLVFFNAFETVNELKHKENRIVFDTITIKGFSTGA